MSSGEEGRGSGFAQAACLLRDFAFAVVSSAVSSLRMLAWNWPRRESRGSGGFELYRGRVWHERRRPLLHRFQYDVRYALVDLDCAPDWFQAAHHLTAAEARSIAGTDGAVRLLTIPTSVGYEQNPLSVYYCYSADTKPMLVNCIAEVTNTPWAERVTFVFEPGLDTVPKPLHVSPFMDMHGTWKMKVSPPGEELQIVIEVQHPELGNYFSAVLKARRVEAGNADFFFWLMPQKVALWIYWHAVLLTFKGVPFISHPKYIDGVAYRENAKSRDEELRSGCKGRLSSTFCDQSTARYCSWREAPCWPWR